MLVLLLKDWQQRKIQSLSTDYLIGGLEMLATLSSANYDNLSKIKIGSELFRLPLENMKLSYKAMGINSLLQEKRDIKEIIEGSKIFIGDYIPIKRLGGGKEGYTYLLKNIEGSEGFRVLKIRYTKDEKEAAVMERINEARKEGYTIDNVVSITDSGKSIAWVDDKTAYVIMQEYVPGKTLAQLLKENGKFNTEDVLKIIVPIFIATRQLETIGIFQNDTNPSNIIVAENLTKSTLVDFGLGTFVPYDSSDISIRHGAKSNYATIGYVIFEMGVGENFIFPRRKQMDTQLHRDFIMKNKKSMYDVNKLNFKYTERVKRKVDPMLHDLIFTCLNDVYNPDAIQAEFIKIQPDLKYDFMSKEENKSAHITKDDLIYTLQQQIYKLKHDKLKK